MRGERLRVMERTAHFFTLNFSLPRSRQGGQLQEVLLQDVIVIFSHNLSVNDTVISKQAKRGLDVILNIVYEDKG